MHDTYTRCNTINQLTLNSISLHLGLETFASHLALYHQLAEAIYRDLGVTFHNISIMTSAAKRPCM